MIPVSGVSSAVTCELLFRMAQEAALNLKEMGGEEAMGFCDRDGGTDRVVEHRCC